MLRKRSNQKLVILHYNKYKATTRSLCESQRERLYYDRVMGKGRSTIIFMVFTADYWDRSKRNMNAYISKPSEHPIKAFIRWEHRLPGQDLFRRLIVLR